MARTINIRVAHGTTQDQALASIQNGSDRLLAKYGERISDLVFAWDGPRLTAQCRALGQTVTSQTEVTASDVIVDVQLPILLGLFSDKIRDFLERKVTRMIENGKA